MFFNRLVSVMAFFPTLLAVAQQPASSGTFVLHKFAQAIGKETYAIEGKGQTYTLTSHFLFNDRSSPVPLDTTFTASTADMKPVAYSAKGRVSRMSVMDDVIAVSGDSIDITRTGAKSTLVASGPWFVTDGYSPVAMQEQMMRWWLTHGKPAEFTIYPANAKVHILPTGDEVALGHRSHGYTVAGLIWGQECLWIDDDHNLVALISTDAEFDHFEAIREPYAAALGNFIAAAAKSNLAALAKLSSAARTAPAHLLAITGATLEDSVGGPPIRDSVILIQDGVITAAGQRSRINIPSGATVLDAKGKYAVPGLWDMHAHYEQVEWGPIYLAAGVTSVRDCGNEFEFIKTMRDELDRTTDRAIGPHLEFAGIVDGSGKDGRRARTLGAIVVDTPEQARDWVAKYKAAGARQIKIYSSVSPEVVQAITAAAHANGMTVTGHIPDGMTAIQGIDDGMDQINHITYEIPYFVSSSLGKDGKPDRSRPPVVELDGPRARQLIASLKSHHTVLDPTMAIWETFSLTRPLRESEPGIEHVPPQLYEALNTPPAPADRAGDMNRRWRIMMDVLRELHAAGIPIVAGTDQAIPGFSLHRELELYVEAGFTPLEALQSATIEAARAVGVASESGSITPGKRGDVLLLDADPLADIHNTRKVWRTIAAGAIYDPAPLWRSVDFKP